MPPPRRRAATAAAAAFAALVLVLVPAAPAAAHGVGQSTLRLRVDGARIEGDWEIHLGDARRALGLAPGLTGEAAFRDLQAHEPALRALLERSLTIRGDSLDCPCRMGPAPMAWNARFDDVVLAVGATCPAPPARLTLGDTFLFDLDPSRRGYFSVEDARSFNVGVFRDRERRVTFAVRQFNPAGTVVEFVREGIGHIASGADHLLFLLALLLPAVLVREAGRWRPRPGFGRALREVLKVVTAFTVAHSITLAFGFLGVIRLPEAWIETGIALSVFAAAWNNLRPFLPGRAWGMAFLFGLVHGLGFAGALANLALPLRARGLALAAFNLGVEAGQVAIVLLVLPVLYAASRRAWYPRLGMGVGSLAIAFLAVVWALERAFGLLLFSPGR